MSPCQSKEIPEVKLVPIKNINLELVQESKFMKKRFALSKIDLSYNEFIFLQFITWNISAWVKISENLRLEKSIEFEQIIFRIYCFHNSDKIYSRVINQYKSIIRNTIEPLSLSPSHLSILIHRINVKHC